MRWGLIGTGWHARAKIAPALATSDQLAGVVASTPGKAAAFVEEVGAGRPFESLAAMLADPAIDAVFVSTPNDLHLEQVLEAAAAGKHVLVEKPMALDGDQCRQMIDACHQAGVRLGVGFQLRHHPVHREIARLIGAGALGEIVPLRAEWHTAYGPWQNWRADPARAGSDVLGAVGVHVLDLLCALAGAEVADVSALVDRDPATAMERTLAASLRFANGIIAQGSITRRARGPLPSVHVLGTEGSATGVGTLGMAPTGRLQVTRGDTTEERTLPVPDLYAAQFEAFAQAAAAGREPDASGADGLRSVLLSARLLSH
jgi:1,5-anhydro-D-fructose reductase (1,5-anhydro-D-mannitol-forming)